VHMPPQAAHTRRQVVALSCQQPCVSAPVGSPSTHEHNAGAAVGLTGHPVAVTAAATDIDSATHAKGGRGVATRGWKGRRDIRAAHGYRVGCWVRWVLRLDGASLGSRATQILKCGLTNTSKQLVSLHAMQPVQAAPLAQSAPRSPVVDEPSTDEEEHHEGQLPLGDVEPTG
jgi:hypothetical protein